MLKLKISSVVLTALVCLGFSTASEAAEETVTLTGRIVFDGDVPEVEIVSKKGDPIKDSAVCAVEDMHDNTLIINSKNKGIANVFIYIKPRDAKKLDVPESAKESKEKEVVFDQKTCRFTPHAMVIRADQKVRVLSDDSCAHNTHTYPLKNDAVNFSVKANDREGTLMDEMPIGELLPFTVKCDIHPWMTAYWLVSDTPWAAVTDEDGNFKIENLPPGEKLTFAVWHERVGYLEKKLKVDKQDAGATEDLGDMEYKASKFKK